MPKRTYQPSKVRRSRRFGFRARTQSGGAVLSRRRKKKRHRLTVV